MPNASLYVFQTDARGYYAPVNQRAENEARIHGYLRTDRSGEFEVTTIRPGGYPNSTLPEHVHFFVNANGYDERVFEIVFSDDPRMNDRIRSDARTPDSFYSMCTPSRQNATLHCSTTVQMKRVR